jgi:hypothetical protein
MAVLVVVRLPIVSGIAARVREYIVPDKERFSETAWLL